MSGTKLKDSTGRVPRVVGVVGLVLLVATILWMPEPAPEPAIAAPSASAPVPEPEPRAPPPDDPELLKASSRVRRLIPTYPGATFTPMGLMKANGNMMEMGFFQVKVSPREVLDYYTREFGKRGYKVHEQSDGAGGGSVNYYDETLGSIVSVTATRGGNEREPRTLVFPSFINAPEGIHLKADAPSQFPQPQGALTLMRVDDQTEGPSQGSTTLTQVASGTPKSLGEFYRKEMATRGYTASAGRSSADAEMLEFTRQGERVQMTISSMANKQGAPESIIAMVVERVPQKQGGQP